MAILRGFPPSSIIPPIYSKPGIYAPGKPEPKLKNKWLNRLSG